MNMIGRIRLGERNVGRPCDVVIEDVSLGMELIVRPELAHLTIHQAAQMS